jgi:hypothetical protein
MDTPPDLHSISENDPRVLGSKYYGDLPPQEVHFNGKIRHLGMSNHTEAMLHDNPEVNQSVGLHIGKLHLAMKSPSNFLHVDLANNAVIEDLKKEVSELTSKCKSYESILKTQQKQLLNIEHH